MEKFEPEAARVNSSNDIVEDKENKENYVHSQTDLSRNDGDEDYPQGIRLALITCSLMFAVFIMALDTTILCKRIFPVWNILENISLIEYQSDCGS